MKNKNIDINQLKANSETWQQIKKTAYAGSLGTNEQFDESIQKIADGCRTSRLLSWTQLF